MCRAGYVFPRERADQAVTFFMAFSSQLAMSSIAIFLFMTSSIIKDSPSSGLTLKRIAVHSQKYCGARKCNTFVSIYKAVVLAKTLEQRGGLHR